MRNLEFKRAAAWNFLPFGPEGIELEFAKYGNIVLIQGENKDAKSIDSSQPIDSVRVNSNGSGKSSIQELIVWSLYGKTIKRPEKIAIDDVIHNKIGKDCKTLVDFDKYRVVRTRSCKGKNSLRLWESDQGIWDDSTEITQGTMPLTQKKIEEKVGLSYDSFINICIFTDDQRSCFLECDRETKLEIVENLMQLGVYREWFENAKALRKEIKGKIDVKSKEYSLLLSNKDDAKRRLDLTQKKQKDWVTLKAQEQVNLADKITLKTQDLGKTDTGQALVLYQQAQEKILSVNLKIPELESTRDELEKRSKLVKEKELVFKDDAQKITEEFNQHSRDAKSFLEDRKKKELEIANLEAEVAGTRCGKCRSVVEAQNIDTYIIDLKRQIADINLDINKCMAAGKEVAVKVEEIKASQTKLRQLETQTEQKRKTINEQLAILRSELTTASQVREPKADSVELLIQQQIEELVRQLAEKKNEATGPSPFDEILENDKKELLNITLSVNEKDKEVKNFESELPYFDYWISGFGPHGIRKWIIDGIISDLNSRVNYWLQFLIDNVVTLKFDNELKETIERNPPDGDPYIYYAMSTGQRRRLNLAVGHSFAYITELSAEAVPSIIFLDEVTTNVDVSGTIGIYKMICELAEDKQVFVTTHDPDLVRMLQGCSVIDLVHENGFTKIKS